ncbi:Nuclear transport factor 2 family protein [Paraburkholderia unamae]|uniref:nuclear transport factor 2 family protein n=1 Tax=Paraburkholderia unamae TaxID=219649 RepID=UPI000DC5B7D6|nr:nuclear transport factor 2 family protein [Paraburkholderia unamae]RAR57966.1 steroid delta-isomerase-like uncharacterized protein [Paraburkholderia unamae]CAG9259885.1 Nuclear transport factor 2 family protein [Paraburkholderia unamae]
MSSRATITQFFDCYRAHDVAGMLALCAPQAKIDYVPLGATGSAEVIGRQIWASLVEAFPDLQNKIVALHASDTDRAVTAEVVIGGTQARDFLGIANHARSFSVRHAFIFQLDPQARIERITAYWDNTKLFGDLGKLASV